jgi:hypothetical protein
LALFADVADVAVVALVAIVAKLELNEYDALVALFADVADVAVVALLLQLDVIGYVDPVVSEEPAFAANEAVKL